MANYYFTHSVPFQHFSLIIHRPSSSSRNEIKLSRSSHGEVKQYKSVSPCNTAVPFVGREERVLMNKHVNKRIIGDYHIAPCFHGPNAFL
jgi:hypothetical protein